MPSNTGACIAGSFLLFCHGQQERPARVVALSCRESVGSAVRVGTDVLWAGTQDRRDALRLLAAQPL
jgi:hypothetical protein